MNESKLTIGADEVGRGCGAGPLLACAFIFIKPCSIKVRDSKELSPKKRETLFKELSELRKNGLVDWVTLSTGSDIIDKMGIQTVNIETIRNAVRRLIEKRQKNDFQIVVDGTLKLSPLEINEKSYELISEIKADKGYPQVSAASIVAKVIRDKYMDILHEKYSQYGWIRNKGYLTAEHCAAIKQYGISPFHRKTFCKALNGS